MPEMSDNGAQATTGAALLTVALRDLEPMQAALGVEVVRLALRELQQDLHDMGAHLLAQHEQLHTLQQPGRWAVLFRERADGLPRESAETWQAIVDAARALTDRVLMRIFGQGWRLVHSVVQVLPVPEPLARAPHDATLAGWLHEHLSTLPPQAWRLPGQRHHAANAELDELIKSCGIRTLLQPIVELRSGRVMGYEALSRGPAGSPLEQPDRLFGAAREAGREAELELLCARLALERSRGRIPAGQFLTINLGPQTLARAATELPLSGRTEVLIELTEHMPLDQLAPLLQAVQALRALGVGLVLDDTGCGFADVDTVEALRPEIVKLCITVVRQVEADAPVQQSIAATVRRLRELGSRVLAEGVETASQQAVLAGWPIELAQGWLFSRAEPLDQVLPA